MANKKQIPKEVKNDRIPVLCSEADYERHGSKEALSIKLRAVRDCNGACELCECKPKGAK